MALRDEIEDPTRKFSMEVNIGGIPLFAQVEPTLPEGIPGVISLSVKKSIANPVPIASIRVNRIPNWMNVGFFSKVTVELGYNSERATVFTGYIQDRAHGEFDGIVRAAGQSYSLWRTVQITPQTFAPGITTKVAIQQVVDYAIKDNRLPLIIPSTSNVNLTDSSYYTLFSDLGVGSELERATAAQMIQTIADIEHWVMWENNAGTLVFQDLHTPGDISSRTLGTQVASESWIIGQRSREDPNSLRTRLTVLGGTYTTGVPPADVTLTPERTAEVKPDIVGDLVELPDDSFIDAEYSNSLIHENGRAADLARAMLDVQTFVPRQVTMRIPGDPEMDIGQTIELDYPEKNLVAPFYIFGIEHKVDNTGYHTILDLRGGEGVGPSQIGIIPKAGFDAKIDREIYNDGLKVFATFDGSSISRAENGDTGDALTYDWSDNQATVFTPDIDAATDSVITIVLDPDDLSLPWIVSLQVTDSNGLVSEKVDLTVDVTPSGTDVQIPAVFAAIDNRQSATPDGGGNWYDITDVNVDAVTARPPDGVNTGIAVFGQADGSIHKTTDFCQTALTVVKVAGGGAITDMQWDWRDAEKVWAVDDTGKVYLSSNGGDGWGLYLDGRATIANGGLGLSGLTLHHIGLPASGGIHVYGGDGAGTPVIAFDDTTGGHSWLQRTLGGELGADIPAISNDYRIIDAVDVGYGLAIALENADSGGGGGGLSFAQGTYSGNGTNQDITGLGFQPKVVIVKADHATNGHAMVRTTEMSNAQNLTNGTEDGGIDELAADGFGVTHVASASGRTNESGKTYYWYAYSGGKCKTGSYIGNGTAKAVTGVGGLPVVASVIPADNSATRFRTTDMGAEDFDYGLGAGETDAIQTLDADGFSVGPSVDVNNDGSTYFYWCLLAATNLHVGTYTGDDADGRNLPASAMSFDPDFVYIKGNANQEGRWKVTALAGDAALQNGSEVAVANRIQSLVPASGKFEVGTNAEVNSSAVGTYYFFAVEDASVGSGSAGPVYYNPNPADPSTWVRATGLSAAFVDAAYIVGGTVLVKRFYVGEQGSRSSWRSAVGGIAYTESTNVFPANVSPHHAIWLPSHIHNLNTASVYLIACEDSSAQASGIYKSADTILTVQAIRPVATFSTWPASAIGRMVAVGSPAIPVSAGGVGVLTSGADNAKPNPKSAYYLKPGSVNWVETNMSNPLIGDRSRTYAVTANDWFLVDSGGHAQTDTNPEKEPVEVSHDSGATWTPAPIGDEAPGAIPISGITHVARDADGRIWGMRNSGNSNNDPVKQDIYYLDTDGLSWIYSTSIEAAISSRRFGYRLITHPTDKNIIAAFSTMPDQGASDTRVITHITKDRGVTWTTNGTTTSVASGNNFAMKFGDALIGYNLAFLHSGRIIAVVHDSAFTGGSNDQHFHYSDDDGDTWTIDTQVDTTVDTFYILAGISPSKIVTFRARVSNGTIFDEQAWVSTDFGVSYVAIGPVFPRTESGSTGTGWSAKYDPISDTLVVFNSANAVGQERVQMMTPVSAGGVWTDITFDLPDNLGNTWDTMSLIP